MREMERQKDELLTQKKLGEELKDPKKRQQHFKEES
jgi:hypothetical protein